MAYVDGHLGRDEPYLMAHWRGNLPLAQAYWINGVLTTTVFALVAQGLFSGLGEGDANLTVTSISVLAVTAISLAVSIWAWVGIWRSASKSSSGWAALAKASVALGFLSQIAQINSLAGWGAEVFQLAIGKDSIGELAELTITDNELMLYGPLTNGIGKKVAEVLNGHPEVTTLKVNSGGGRLYEAEQISALVSRKGLDVVVSGECSSACTIILLSGKLRALEADAVVGFHRPDFPGMTTVELDKMADQLGDAYERLGLPWRFVRRVLQVPPNDMWYPEEEELFKVEVLNGFTKARIAAEMRNDADTQNSRTPNRIDEITVLQRVEHEGTRLRYQYRLDADADQLLPSFTQVIEKGVKESHCARPIMIEFMASGAIYEHVYVDRSGKVAAKVTVSGCD
jgi:hypothetical protein